MDLESPWPSAILPSLRVQFDRFIPLQRCFIIHESTKNPSSLFIFLKIFWFFRLEVARAALPNKDALRWRSLVRLKLLLVSPTCSCNIPFFDFLCSLKYYSGRRPKSSSQQWRKSGWGWVRCTAKLQETKRVRSSSASSNRCVS